MSTAFLSASPSPATRADSHPPETGGAPAGARTPPAGIRVLVVDDDRAVREGCAGVLRLGGYDVAACDDSDRAFTLLRHGRYDIVLLSLRMTPIDGLTFLRSMHALDSTTIAIVITDDPRTDVSLAALRAGAWDYLVKPFSASHLQALVDRAALTVNTDAAMRASGHTPSDGTAAEYGGEVILLGSSPAFRKAVATARALAQSDTPMLIAGETGSGKSLLARYIHRRSARADQPFIMLDCSILSNTQFESELFNRIADEHPGGTVYLAELPSMPRPTQSRLARQLQEMAARQTNGEPAGASPIRFVASTCLDPETVLRLGQLSDELFFQIGTVSLAMPPLRERTEDIPSLADYFLSVAWNRRGGTPATRPELTDASLLALAQDPWRDNVRGLRIVIDRAAAIAEPGATIDPDALALTQDARPPGINSLTAAGPTLLEESYHPARERVLAEFETRYLAWLMRRAGGNMSHAARIAEVDRTTLYRLMERHGLQRQTSAGLLIRETPRAIPLNAAPVRAVPDE